MGGWSRAFSLALFVILILSIDVAAQKIKPQLAATGLTTDGYFRGVFTNGVGAPIRITGVAAKIADASGQCIGAPDYPIGPIPAGDNFNIGITGCAQSITPMTGDVYSFSVKIDYEVEIGGVKTTHSDGATLRAPYEGNSGKPIVTEPIATISYPAETKEPKKSIFDFKLDPEKFVPAFLILLVAAMAILKSKKVDARGYKKRIMLCLAVMLLFFICYSVYILDLDAFTSGQQTLLLTQNQFTQDSVVSFRVITLDGRNGAPKAASPVVVKLKPADGGILSQKTLYEGVTDGRGSADIRFNISNEWSEGDYELSVTAGEDTVKDSIKVVRKAKILLTTDKPIYQPDQVINARALVLNPFSLKPYANKTVVFEIEDSKANKIYKQVQSTNRFGIASTQLALGDDINLGRYTIRAIFDKSVQEKKVDVKKYALPKFRVDFSSDQRYYTPNAKVKAGISANYFFGKPVANGFVDIQVLANAITLKEVQRIQGRIDGNGNFDFTVNLPDYFVGLPRDKGDGFAAFNITVTDSAGHAQTILRTIPVSNDLIKVETFPESERLKYGMDNMVYVITSYPDGAPAKTMLDINGKKTETNNLGIAQFTIRPDVQGAYSLAISAVDEGGKRTAVTRQFNSEGGVEHIILRADRPVYNVGETAVFDCIYSGAYGTKSVYVDIIKSRQTILTKAVDLKNNRATVSVDLTNDMAGTLEVHCYKTMRSTDIVRDVRHVIVNEGKDLKVDVTADKRVYLPGENAKISFSVTGDEGPVQSAIGVSIVDESVYALEELQPGFERLYFLLENELMTPRYQVKIFSPYELVDKISKNEPVNLTVIEPVPVVEAEKVASVLIKAANLTSTDYDIKQDSLAQKQAAIKKAKEDYWSGLWAWSWAFVKYGFIIGYIVCFLFGAYMSVKDRQKWIWALVAISIMVVAAYFLGIADYIEKTIGHRNYYSGETLLDKIIKYGSIICFSICVIYGAIQAVLRKEKRVIALIAASILSVAFFFFMDQAPYSMRDSLLCLMPIFFLVVMLLPVAFIVIPACSIWWATERLFKEDDGAKSKRTAATIVLSMAAFVQGIIIFFSITSRGYTYGGDYSIFVIWSVLAIIALLLPLALFIIPIYGLYRMRSGKENDGKRSLILTLIMFGWIPVLLLVFGVVWWQLGIFNMGSASMTSSGGFDQSLMTKSLRMSREAAVTEGKPYLRQFFPETMYYNPSLITDENGNVDVSFQVADSITTWRLNALASTVDGRLGSKTSSIRVFQDFFVDIDAPRILTQEDEVWLPVAIYNYLDRQQDVRLELTGTGWFTLLDDANKTIQLKPNEVSVVFYHIRAKEHGVHSLTVYAYGSKMEDAISRQIEVQPYGQEQTVAVSGALDRDIKQEIIIPEYAVNGTEKIIVKIYPGYFSHVVDGLDKIFRMPFGCFEQTTSITYPNVLVLDYMKKTNHITPELQMQAEHYIATGYQRLMNFETNTPGGFDWGGNPPPKLLLTAYGLLEFKDMSEVYNVDPDLIPRTQTWLASQQSSEGSWENKDYLHFSSNIASSRLMSTCFVTWSLTHSGYGGYELNNGMAYIKSSISRENDPYTLAVCANALLEKDGSDPSGRQILSTLDQMKTEDIANNLTYWKTKAGDTWYGSSGSIKDLEATALATMAYMKAGYNPQTTHRSLNYIIAGKDAYGTWGSTQATILSLQALVYAAEHLQQSEGSAQAIVYFNGQPVSTLRFDKTNNDVLRMVDLGTETRRGDNTVEIKYSGDSNLYYQIVGRYYSPWERQKSAGTGLTIAVDYSTETLRINDMATVNTEIRYSGQDTIKMIIVDLGIPPGFTVMAEDLDQLKKAGDIFRYDVAGRQLILYVRGLEGGKPLRMSYRVKAVYPIKAKTPMSQVYGYYNPDVKDTTKPIELTVTP